MSVTATWARKYWLELAWALFAAANVLVIVRLVNFETVPFHFVWVSLTLVYGYRVWRLRPTLLTLGGVCIATGVAMGWVVTRGPQGPDELTEVPLMGAMFLAMVWHAQRRQVALEQVRQAADREHAFVRDASHQLKTPITIARAHAELVRDAGSASQEDLDILADELRRLSRISEGLLVLAATQEFDSLVWTTFDVADAVDSAGRRWTATTKRRWWFECEAEGTLRADRQRLDFALDALIENAVAATGESDRVAVVCYAERDIAVFEVSDSGIGIPEDFVPKAFDRFTSIRDPDDGARRTGLGLSIVKAVAEAHGGSVALRSVVGRGSTFTIRMPGFQPPAAERHLAEASVPSLSRARRTRDRVAG
jgi:signal transduction histidine kinase